MTNKQEYKQKKFLKLLYQQYVKLDFCRKWQIFGRFVIKWVERKNYLFVTISLNIFELLFFIPYQLFSVVPSFRFCFISSFLYPFPKSLVSLKFLLAQSLEQ
jgi:hypothetical protein